MQETWFGKRVYRMRPWQRTLYIVLGVFIGGIGIVPALIAAQQSRTSLLPVFAIFPAVLGLYFIALALRTRLIIDRAHIEVRGVLREQIAELSDVEGYRTISTRNGSFWRLQLKNGRTISIQKWFDCDELRAWFQQLTDFDERDRNELLEEIKEAQDLGTTPDERLNALKQAKQLNIALSLLAITAGVVFFFSQGLVHLTAAVVLALAPVFVLYVMWQDPLLYTLGKPQKDPRTDLTIAFLVSGIGLMLSMSRIQFVSFRVLVPWVVVIMFTFTAGFYLPARMEANSGKNLLLALIFSGVYGLGLVVSIDTLLDHSPAQTYMTSVAGEHIVHGKSTSYYLDLAPWGPFAGTNKLNVPRSEYTQAQIGDTICLLLHPGYLHAGWYKRIDCRDRFIVNPTQ